MKIFHPAAAGPELQHVAVLVFSDVRYVERLYFRLVCSLVSIDL